MTSLTRFAAGCRTAGLGAEDSQLEIRIGRARPVGRVVDPHRGRADKRAGKLRERVAHHLAEVAGHDGGSQGDGRIQVCVGAAAGDRGEDAGDNGKRPARRDRQPSRAFSLGSFQQHAGDHAIAQQDEDRGPGELSEHR